jgi:CheY-like chemotaxis protein
MSSSYQVGEMTVSARTRVLVVEDEELLRVVLCRQLMNAGYEAVEARDGREAVKILRGERPFALVLTDMIMPVMDGAELVIEIRRRWPDLKVLAMSAYSPAELFRFGIPHVDGPFLRKPFTPEDLVLAVHAALDRPPGTAA